MAKSVSAARPAARALYTFTPLASFEHKDDFGNILSAYTVGSNYTVREGNTALAALVATWVKEQKVRIGA